MNEGPQQQAIVNYVVDSIQRGRSKELRIALLTHDAHDDIANRIIQRFILKFKERLQEKVPEMESRIGDTGEDLWSQYAWLIGWRHKTWTGGSCICLEFDKSNLRGLFVGVRAPNAQALEEDADEEQRKDYDPVDESTREQIHKNLSDDPIEFYRPSEPWYPAFDYLAKPFDDLTSTEALLALADVDKDKLPDSYTYNGRRFIDWLADEFLMIRDALQTVTWSGRTRKRNRLERS